MRKRVRKRERIKDVRKVRGNSFVARGLFTALVPTDVGGGGGGGGGGILFVFEDTVEGPMAPALKPVRVTQEKSSSVMHICLDLFANAVPACHRAERCHHVVDP